MSATITLRAVDLFVKHGFGDGDVLELLWDELEAEGFGPHQDGLLETLVERHLAPLLPAGVKIERVSSHHNPIRIHHDHDADEELREQLVDVAAEISLEQILTVARELRNSK